MRARQTGRITAVLLVAASCLAQAPLPGDGDFHGTPSSIEVSRSEFGSECGIQDTSKAAALTFSVDDGGWSPGASSRVVETARLWHQTNYMVDLHGAPGPGMSSMHSGMMCFDEKGRLTHAFDNYMDVPQCGCRRWTTMTFAADGTMTEWAQTFVDLRSGDHIKSPANAEELPKVWEFQRMDQLPFHSLLKLNQERPTGQTDEKR